MRRTLTSARDGLESSLRASDAVRALLRSDVAVDRMVRCVELNGVVFGGSLALSAVALPTVLARLADALLGGEDDAERSQTLDAAMRSANAALAATWFAPMAVLSYALSTVWWADIAAQMQDARRERAPAAEPPRHSFVANEMYRALLVLVLTLESYLAMQPAWTCAFYCFDYRWCLDGWPLERRIAEFEHRWAFMLGFGAPLALVGLALPLLTSCVVYALVFPVCMVVAVVGDAPPSEPRRLRVFWTASWLLRHALRFAVGGGAASAAPAAKRRS